jgi:hypothetical protein
MSGMTGSAGRAWPAFGLCTLAIAEGLTMRVGTEVVGLSFAAARDSFMISNAAIGLSAAMCGVLIAWKRPRNPLGWLLLGAGIAQTGTAAVTPWLVQALREGWTGAPLRALATLYSAAWPWSVSLFVPLTLLFFPDGRGWVRPYWPRWSSPSRSTRCRCACNGGSTGCSTATGPTRYGPRRR